MHNRSLSMMKFLLVAVVIASLFCCSSADSDFFLVGSDLTTCLGVSKLHTTHCNKDDDMELHCVLDDDDQLGIGYLKKIWVPRGCCPFYRKYYDVLDYRPCVAEASACPNNVDQYLSNGVYKYPGCLQESTITRRCTQTPVNIAEDITISSHGPWSSVGPICFGLLILAVIMLALLLLLLRKTRNRQLSYGLSDSNEPCIPQVHYYNSLRTSQEDRHLTMDNTPWVVPMENTKFKDTLSPIVSTWPKASAPEREKSIVQLNPTFLPEPDA